MTTSRTRRARAVTAAMAGLFTLTSCGDFSVTSLPLPGGADLGDDPFSVTVEFRDVLDLVPQSSVKIDDVTVGKVDAIDLKGYTAVVTVKVRGDVDLPDNAVAEIRQTSLLGEKFVQLASPETGASTERLSEGDVITLDRSGRNPEVEEVLGALSLVLNGGGVAQLKTIASEVNAALEGNESDVKSVLRRISEFMGQLDANKEDIVLALDRVSKFSADLNRQEETLDVALDNLPQAIASVDRQRDDLVKMLEALAELSDVGTRVIQQSKAATIDSLEALAPTLTKFAEAGDDFPRSLELFLTFPFPDGIVGKNPQQARDFHMGDYSNLDMTMDVDLRSFNFNNLPSVPGFSIPELLEICAETPLDPVCKQLAELELPPLPINLPVDLPPVGLPRTAPLIDGGQTTATAAQPQAQRSDLSAMLTWGMVGR